MVPVMSLWDGEKVNILLLIPDKMKIIGILQFIQRDTPGRWTKMLHCMRCGLRRIFQQNISYVWMELFL